MMEVEETSAEAEAREAGMTRDDFTPDHFVKILGMIFLFILCMYIIESSNCSGCTVVPLSDTEIINSLVPPVTVVSVAKDTSPESTKVLLKDKTGKIVTIVDRVFVNVKPGDVIR